MANNKFLEETGLSRFWAHVKKFAVEQAQRPNDNLLINSDFKSGIINQKGQTSYGYVDKPLLTIDMWITYGVNIAIDATSIRVINRQTNARTLRQYINGDSGVYTVYVNVKTISGNVYVNLNNDTSKNKKLAQGENKFQITVLSTESLKSFALYLEANADVYIYSIKLEKGPHFTDMPTWDKSTELLKCCRKFQKMNITVPVLYSTDTSTSVEIPFMVEMDKTPTVTIEILRLKSRTATEIMVSKYEKTVTTQKLNVQMTHQSNTNYQRYADVNFYADSNDY